MKHNYTNIICGIPTFQWKGLINARASFSVSGACVTKAPLSANVKNEKSTTLERSQLRAMSPKKNSTSY